MNREEAQRRLKETSGFTFVGGRVRISDSQLLATVAELRGSEPAKREAHAATTLAGLADRTAA